MRLLCRTLIMCLLFMLATYSVPVQASNHKKVPKTHCQVMVVAVCDELNTRLFTRCEQAKAVPLIAQYKRCKPLTQARNHCDTIYRFKRLYIVCNDRTSLKTRQVLPRPKKLINHRFDALAYNVPYTMIV